MTTMERMTVTARAVKDHPATPWFQWVIGAGMIGVSLYLIVVERAADRFHTIAHGVVGFVGIGVLPPLVTALASSARTALELYRQWKSNGAAPPPSGS